MALDPSHYADITGDKLPDVSVGRIAGISSSDVSSYLARSIFYSEFQKTNNMKFLASSFGGVLGAMTQKISAIFKGAGYNSIDIIYAEEMPEFDPIEWENQDLIYYTDHGGSQWSGIESNEIPQLENSLILSASCSTVSTSDKDSFWAHAIRKGAIGYLGAAGTTFLSSDYSHFLNNVYYSDISILGSAFKNSYDSTSSRAMTMLVGDPTLDISPDYLLQEEIPIIDIDLDDILSLIEWLGLDPSFQELAPFMETLTQCLPEDSYCCPFEICGTYGILQCCGEGFGCGWVSSIMGKCCDITDPDCFAGEFCDDGKDNDFDGEIDEADCVCKNKNTHCGTGGSCEDCTQSTVEFCGSGTYSNRLMVKKANCVNNYCLMGSDLGADVVEDCGKKDPEDLSCDLFKTRVIGKYSKCDLFDDKCSKRIFKWNVGEKCEFGCSKEGGAHCMTWEESCTPDDSVCLLNGDCCSGLQCSWFTCQDCKTENEACTWDSDCCEGEGPCKGGSCGYQDIGEWCLWPGDCEGNANCIFYSCKECLGANTKVNLFTQGECCDGWKWVPKSFPKVCCWGKWYEPWKCGASASKCGEYSLNIDMDCK